MVNSFGTGLIQWVQRVFRQQVNVGNVSFLRRCTSSILYINSGLESTLFSFTEIQMTQHMICLYLTVCTEQNWSWKHFLIDYNTLSLTKVIKWEQRLLHFFLFLGKMNFFRFQKRMWKNFIKFSQNMITIWMNFNLRWQCQNWTFQDISLNMHPSGDVSFVTKITGIKWNTFT